MNEQVADALGIGSDTIRIGVVAPDSAADVRRLEAAGASSFWVGGHVASTNPTPEAMMALARVADRTTDAVIGTATLLLPLYPPGLVAKQLADLDRATGGRVAVGVGVGGEYDSDFRAVEVPRRERGSRTDEAIELLRRFWTADPVTWNGRHHRFDDVRIHPAPAQPGGPPILVSGRSEFAMRRAARLGDGWMPYLYSSERYRRSVARIRELAAEAGRDLGSFAWSCYVFVALADHSVAATRIASEFFGATYRQDVSEFVGRVSCVGNVEQVTEQLQGFVAAGARQLILVPMNDDLISTTMRLLTEIAPLLRTSGPSRTGSFEAEA